MFENLLLTEYIPLEEIPNIIVINVLSEVFIIHQTKPFGTNGNEYFTI